MLIAHGGFNLPYKVVGLQYLNYEGGKFSKSKRWGVFCENLPKAGLEPDYWRFYLSLLIPETTDTDFKWEEFKERINGDLIGNLGNFIHRTLSFIYNKSEGDVVRPTEFSESDKELIQKVKEKVKQIDQCFAKTELRKALKEILVLSQEGNKYFDYNAPWKLIKEDKDRANAVLYICANLCRDLAILIAPFLPDTAQRIWEQLNLEGEIYKEDVWESAGKFVLPAKHKINKPHILFATIDDELLNRVRKIALEVKDLKDFFKD
jgi:methionyl-tRNA synthetase